LGITRSFRPLEVRALHDRALAVGHVAKAQVEEAQDDHALLRQLGGQRLADRAVDHRVGLLRIREEEGEVQHAELLDDAVERRRRGDQHLLHAALQRGLLLQLVAQLGRGELLHLDLAAALGGHELGELLHAQAGGVAHVVEVAELDGALLHLGAGAGGHDECERGEGAAGDRFHACLLG
jgi:hypothetical protein